MKKYIVCYVLESEYGVLFYQYLVRSNLFNSQIIMFSEQLQVEKFISQNRVELLILDEKSKLSEELLQTISRVVYMVSEREKEDQKDYIYKYQSMDYISSLLTRKQARNEGPWLDEKKSNDDELKVDVIIPCCQGISSGDMTFCVARAMAERESICYVNLTQFEQVEWNKQNEEAYSISDLIYLLKQKGDIRETVHNIIQKKQNVMYISSVDHGIDLLDFSGEYAEIFYKVLNEEKIAQKLIVVVDQFTEYTKYFLDSCNDIYFVMTQGELEARKVRKIERQIVDYLKNKSIENIKKIEISNAIVEKYHSSSDHDSLMKKELWGELLNQV